MKNMNCFNPSFSGISSLTNSSKSMHESSLRFNPSFSGISSLTIKMK